MTAMAPLGRVGIVMMSAVGDAVHVLPVVTALKRHDRAVHITWILQPGPASLVRGHPDVDEILMFRRDGGMAGLRELRAQLRERPFDLVLDLQVYLKASLVTLLTRAPVKVGFDRARARDLNWLVTNRKIPPHAPQHVQDQYFEFLRHLQIPHEPVEWKLGPRPEERAALRELLSRYERPVAVLAIGSSHSDRMWLPERWARVAEELYEAHGLQPVLAGGGSPPEIETERAILQSSTVPVYSTLGGSLRELVALIDAAALVIGLNSAPMHMAVALDTPVISLLSSVNPKRTGPYRRFHDLTIDVYGNRGEDYEISLEKRPSRMMEIEVVDVLEKVEVWRERYSGRQHSNRMAE